MIREESSGGEEKNIVKASGFSLPVPHKGLTPRYLQRLPLYGVAFPNPRPPGSRAGLKDMKKVLTSELDGININVTWYKHQS